MFGFSAYYFGISGNQRSHAPGNMKNRPVRTPTASSGACRYPNRQAACCTLQNVAYKQQTGYCNYFILFYFSLALYNVYSVSTDGIRGCCYLTEFEMLQLTPLCAVKMIFWSRGVINR